MYAITLLELYYFVMYLLIITLSSYLPKTLYPLGLAPSVPAALMDPNIPE